MRSKRSWRPEYDVLVAGGGPVGACLALALRPLGLAVGVVEARAPGTLPAPGGFDARATALAWGSRCILEAIGAWTRLAPDAAAIRRVHVSEHRRFGSALLDAGETGVPALGYVVEHASLLHALDAALGDGGIDLMQPATVTDIRESSDGVVLTVAGETVRTRLLVVADGARSATRELIGIPARVHDYGQTAVVANVATSRPHHGTAWERFTPAGPLALLPLTGDRCGVVWTVGSDDAEAALTSADDAFASRVGTLTGHRLGAITRVGTRQAWPLVRVLAARQRQGRAVLLGNAAHSLHPVAGQGFNLGLRDAAALADAIADGVRSHGDPAAAAALDAWDAARRIDQRRVGAFVDGLNSVFTFGLPGFARLRGAGIGLFGLWPSGRTLLARYGAGAAGTLPRLARGVPL